MDISERFWPILSQHPTIASCLKQAEMYRTHFATTLYDPATVTSLFINKPIIPSIFGVSKHSLLSSKIHQQVAKHQNTCTCIKPSGCSFCLQQMMSTATQILQHLRFVQNESSEHSSNVKAVVKRLTNTIRPFTHQLNSINQIYTSIHVFFFIYEKVCKNSSSL